MARLNLIRDYFTSYCTLGRLVDPVTGKGWDTMERPWVPASGTASGVKGYSCIGLGEYKLQRYSSDAHPNVLAVSNPGLDVYVTEMQVPPEKRGVARTRVLVHPANWASELRGCIAPGKTRAKDADGIWMVTHSRDAMNEVRNLLLRALDITLDISSGGPSNGVQQ